jgi:hypothetical protein
MLAKSTMEANMGILEIVLLVKAWKKGWGARALLPLAFALGTAVFIRSAIGAGAGSGVNLNSLGFFLDLGTVIALALMARQAPSPGAKVASETRAPLTEWEPEKR